MGGVVTVKPSHAITAKPSRSARTPAPEPDQGPAAPSGGPIRSWVRFWFTPADPVGLHAVRFLAGLLLLAWLLPLAGHLDGLFGLNGWFDQQAYAEAARLPFGPPKPITWSVLYLVGSDPAKLQGVYWLSVAVVVLFTVGLFPRITSVLTWVAVASFTAHPAIDADADPLLLLLSFYLMIGYLLLYQGDAKQSLVTRLLGPWPGWLRRRPERDEGSEPRPSLGANVALRLLQVHLAIVVVTTGLHKLQFGDWWAGVALWYPLYPPFQTTVADARVHAEYAQLYLGLLSVAAYLVLAWQIGFPMFAWRPRWRPVLLGGAALGWLGAALVYRLPLVGPAFFVGCLSFVSPAEWHRLATLAARVPGVGKLGRWLPVLPGGPAGKSEATASLVTAGQR
jgi:hypothetical protein